MPTCTFPFHLVADGSGYSVQLTIGTQTASAPFEFDLSPESRVGGVLGEIAGGRARYDDLREIGSLLYSGLVNGPVAALFEETLKAREEAAASPGAGAEPACVVFRLSLPPALQPLPWECLHDERRIGFFFSDLRYSLVRDVPGVMGTPRAARPGLPVKMLAVIPEGSGLSVEHEWHALNLAVDRLRGAIDLVPLDGRVTPDRLRECMDSRQWDIVHFIGHGDVSNDLAQVRLNGDNPESDMWTPGHTFATYFSQNVPRLVVLNSCLGGSQSPRRSLGGIPPYLRRVGVPAVVAMQFEIPDDVAIKFAERFYGELLAGSSRGHVDFAVAAARRALLQNAGRVVHSFAMPVLYRHEDHETLFDIPAADAPARVSAPPARSVVAAPTAASLPEDLVAAFARGRCVPVIGPEVLRVGAVRSSPPPPGPRELARMLADQSGYPEMDEFAVAGPRTKAAGLEPLPSVCQHYERPRRRARYKLVEAVQKAYANVAPPSAVEAIASWDVPGVVCMYFDGLLEEAMARQHRTYRSIAKLNDTLDGYQGEKLLVHLRGVFTAGDSLVLTEKDHEELWDTMRQMPSQVTELTHKVPGISLLVMGVSPRDALVRRLAHALRGEVGTQGPLFFAAPGHTSVDDAYWGQYDVQWVDVEIEPLVQALSALVEVRR